MPACPCSFTLTPRFLTGQVRVRTSSGRPHCAPTVRWTPENGRSKTHFADQRHVHLPKESPVLFRKSRCFKACSCIASDDRAVGKPGFFGRQLCQIHDSRRCFRETRRSSSSPGIRSARLVGTPSPTVSIPAWLWNEAPSPMGRRTRSTPPTTGGQFTWIPLTALPRPRNVRPRRRALREPSRYGGRRHPRRKCFLTRTPGRPRTAPVTGSGRRQRFPAPGANKRAAVQQTLYPATP